MTGREASQCEQTRVKSHGACVEGRGATRRALLHCRPWLWRTSAYRALDLAGFVARVNRLFHISHLP